MSIPSEHLLVIGDLSSHHVAAMVAILHPDKGEQVAAYKRIDCHTDDLSDRGRHEAMAEAVRLVCEQAGIEPWSIYLTRPDADVVSRMAIGWASPGEEMVLTAQDRTWALRRAREQATGADREVLQVVPIVWKVRSREGEREVEDPVGERGNHLQVEALVVSARRGYREQLAAVAKELQLDLDGVIPQPVALYRGVAGRLPKRGLSVVIDMGARHTTILVRRRERLVHIETHAFGGQNLTRRLAEALHIDDERAEALKREVDVSSHATSPAPEGQQFIWSDLQERSVQLAPAARIISEALTAFFKERARDLREQGYLAQQGQVHLVGRGAGLAGLALLLKDVLDLPVVVGSGDRQRQPGDELDGLLTAGLVCCAGDLRRERLFAESTTLRKRASGLWSWLMKPMH